MSNEDSRLETAEIIAALPDICGPWGTLPPELSGAQIRGVGTFKDRSLVSNGGLVIDYIPCGTTVVRRIVFGFCDGGAWVEHLSPVN
jgi:hypothetical protein